MTIKHAYGHIITPTMFNRMCEIYREKVDKNPKDYPYWAGRDPVKAFERYFIDKLGVINIKKADMKALAFLSDTGEETYVDDYNVSHIPFFYFFPCTKQFAGFEAGTVWDNGYRNKHEITDDIEERFTFIKQFFNNRDWEEFSNKIIWILYAY